MQHLNLNPAEFEAERQVVLEELTMGDDHPWEFLRRNVRALAYSQHPYRHPIIGWPEDVAALTVDQMRAFHQRHYQPGNAVLVVAGDLKPADTFRRIEDRFGPIRPPGAAGVIPPDGPPDGRIRFAATRPAHVSRLFIAFHAPSVHHRGTYAAHLLAYILGEGKTSRLYRRLVESDRTATSAAIHFEDMLDPALLGVAVRLKSGVAPPAWRRPYSRKSTSMHREASHRWNWPARAAAHRRCRLRPGGCFQPGDQLRHVRMHHRLSALRAIS